jgi:hypothetical protein
MVDEVLMISKNETLLVMMMMMMMICVRCMNRGRGKEGGTSCQEGFPLRMLEDCGGGDIDGE